MNICVDASLVVKWLADEEGSDIARGLNNAWRKKGTQLIAPGLLDYEVGTALRRKVRGGLFQTEDLFPIFDLYKRSEILLFHLPDLLVQAVPLAISLDQPTIYDIAYLLIAKQQKTDFVTADEKFCRKAQVLYPFVKFYKEYSI